MRAGDRILQSLQQIRDAIRGDFVAIRSMKVTNGCGCVFCDLHLPLHEDEIGFHHVSKDGERAECTASR